LIFTLAMQAGQVLQRPYIPMLKEDNIRTGFFEREQFDAVRRHLQAPLDHAVTLGYYTGWRMASEILTLQWPQIDRAAGVIRLEPGTTKNTEGRTFQYLDLVEVRDAVEALWTRHERSGRKASSPRMCSAGEVDSPSRASTRAGTTPVQLRAARAVFLTTCAERLCET
jgi:integrase